jgi:hypothetical protein
MAALQQFVAAVRKPIPAGLRSHYRDALDSGATKATAKVAAFLFRRTTTEGRKASPR